MSLTGRNIIITGATSGIGVQLASVLSANGANVFIGGRRAEKGDKVAAETRSTFHTVDVADEASNKAFFAAAAEHFGGEQTVDYILLNAGVEGSAEDASIQTLSIENHDYVFGVNVRGFMLGLQHGTPMLRKGGKIYCTSGLLSIIPFALNPTYAATKAALESLVRSYAAQVAQSNDERIRSLSIIAISPCLFATELSNRFSQKNNIEGEKMAKLHNPSGRVGKPDELASTVLGLLNRQITGYNSGDVIACDADTHFPITEFFGRLKAAQQTNIVEED